MGWVGDWQKKRGLGIYAPAAQTAIRKSQATPSTLTAFPTVKKPSTAATAPERFDISFPPIGYQSPKVTTPQPSRGPVPDFLGSIGGGIVDSAQWFLSRAMNPASAIEAPFTTAKAITTSALGDQHPLSQIIGGALDVATGTIGNIAGAVGTVMDLPTNILRNAQTTNRLSLARQLAGGEAMNPFDPANLVLGVARQLGMGGVLGGGSSQLDLAMAAATSGARTSQDTQRAMWDSIDLPEAVKQSIAANPRITDEQLHKLVPEADRQFSYKSGIDGLIGNLLPTGAIMVGEMFALGGANMFLKGVSATGKVAGAGATARIAGTGADAAITTATRATKIMAATWGAGLGVGALGNLVSGIAKTQGNQAAADWWENITEQHPLSDNLEASLGLAWMVDPLMATGMLKRGLIRVGRNEVATIDRATGGAIARFMSEGDTITDIASRAYSGVEPETILAVYGNDMGRLTNRILRAAAEYVVERHPGAAREINARFIGDPTGKIKHVWEQYGDEIESALRNNRDGIADTWRVKGWGYRRYLGRYDPNVMLATDVGWLDAEAKYASLLHLLETDGTTAVVSYVRDLTPNASALVREEVARLAPNATDMIAARDWNLIQRQHPALANATLGFREFDNLAAVDAIPRSLADQVIDAADRMYQTAEKANPQRVDDALRFLRPEETTNPAAIARLFGTDTATMTEVMANKAPEKLSDAMLALGERYGVKAADRAGQTTEETWRNIRANTLLSPIPDHAALAGQQVDDAERMLAAAQGNYAAAVVAREHEAIPSLMAEVKQARVFVAAAHGDMTPFAEELLGARGALRRVVEGQEATWRENVRAAAREKLERIDNIYSEVMTRFPKLAPKDADGFSWVGVKEGRRQAWRSPEGKRVTQKEGVNTPGSTGESVIRMSRDYQPLRQWIGRNPVSGEWVWKQKLPDIPARLARNVLAVLPSTSSTRRLWASGNASIVDLWRSLREGGLWDAPGVWDGIPGGARRYDRTVPAHVLSSAEEFTTATDEFDALVNADEELPRILGAAQDEVDAILGGSTPGTLAREGAVRTSGEVQGARESLQYTGLIDDSMKDPAHAERVTAFHEALDRYEGALAQGKADDAATALADMTSAMHVDGEPDPAFYHYLALAGGDSLPRLVRTAEGRQALRASVKPYELSVGTYEGGPAAQAVAANDAQGMIDALLEAHAANDGTPWRKPQNLTPEQAERVVADPPRSAANDAERRLLAAQANLYAPIDLDAGDPIARRVLELIDSGMPGSGVENARQLISVLRALDDGIGGALGFSVPQIAAARKLASDTLRQVAIDAESALLPLGAVSKGLSYRRILNALSTAGLPRNLRGVKSEIAKLETESAAAVADARVELRARADGYRKAAADARTMVDTPRGPEVMSPGEATRLEKAAARLEEKATTMTDAEAAAAPLVAKELRDAKLDKLRRARTAMEDGTYTRMDDPVAELRSIFEGDTLAERSPSVVAEEEVALARELLGGERPIVVFDASSPVGFTYGLSKAPKDALVLRLDEYPGLMDELRTGMRKGKTLFNPEGVVPGSWEAKAIGAQVRHAFWSVFGGQSNAALRQGLRDRFLTRAASLGLPVEAADDVWKAWQKYAHEIVDVKTHKGKGGGLLTSPAEMRVHGDIWNVPADKLHYLASDAIADFFKSKGLTVPEKFVRYVRQADGSLATEAQHHWGAVFWNESSAVLRGARHLGPLGNVIAALYGPIRRSPWVNTYYYMFRFRLDARFWAMEYFEAPSLYAGSAGMTGVDGSRALMGYTEGYLKARANESLADMGLNAARRRDHFMSRAFAQHPDRMGLMEGAITSQTEATARKALEQMAEKDPTMAALIADMGDTPTAYVDLMDQWFGHVMSGAPDQTIPEAVAAATRDAPELAAVSGALVDANERLFKDVAATFYGNPARSMLERVASNPLLFWPLSYQVKTARWLVRTMLSRMGGLPTHAVPAYTYGQLSAEHERLMAEDPTYAKFIKDHNTLLYIAQMLFPMTPNSMGVSMSPILRDAFFGRTKNVLEIGPVYTYTQLLPDLAGEMYATLGDVPGVRQITGMFGVKPKKALPSIDEMAASLR